LRSGSHAAWQTAIVCPFVYRISDSILSGWVLDAVNAEYNNGIVRQKTRVVDTSPTGLAHNGTPINDRRTPSPEDGIYWYQCCGLAASLERNPIYEEMGNMSGTDIALDGASLGDSPDEVRTMTTASAGWRLCLLATTMLFAVVVALQWHGHAYTSDLGSHADEAAHYVTGLLVHDYLAQHRTTSPSVFAEQYYGHYPKVGIGHWPPVFYVLQGAWSLVFQPSIASVLALVALISALSGGLLTVIVTRAQKLAVGLMAGFLFVASPVVAQSSCMIMADGLVALLMLSATLAFVRFMDSKEAKYSLLFGLLTALAFLTKGNALALVLVPPIAIVISKRWELLARKSFWLGPLLAMALGAPWYWLTRNMEAGTWVYPSPRVAYTVDGLFFYAHTVLRALGSLGTILAVIGLVHYVATPRNAARGRTTIATGLFALLAGVMAVALIVPVGLESRFILPALPPLIFFAAEGALWIAIRVGKLMPQTKRYQTALCAGLLAIALVLGFAPVHKEYSGLAKVADVILENSSPDYPSVLIVSDAAGEGMFVADMALHRRESQSIVVRGTKALADSNWMGTEYKSLCQDPREVVELLDKLPITYLVEDRSVGPAGLRPHQKLVEQAIADYPTYFELLGKFSAVRDGVQYPDSVYLYRFLHTKTPDRVLRLSMSRMFRSDIEVVVPASKQ
jgi:Dolichyl-phosphate-mannose-protein mannosyltransferase